MGGFQNRKDRRREALGAIRIYMKFGLSKEEMIRRVLVEYGYSVPHIYNLIKEVTLLKENEQKDKGASIP